MIRIARESPHRFDDYARISIAFEVRRVLDVRVSQAAGERELVTAERPIPTPYLKDYDALPGASPTSWPDRFDTSTWAVFAAYVGDDRVGGAVGIMGPRELDMLEGRLDLAVLWDIRVAPDVRGRGVGVSLLKAVETWALDQGAHTLKVETQDINVPACRFYARHGFRLRAANRRAYPELPDETQLLWYKTVGPDHR